MSTQKRLALRIILWVADVILGDEITDKEQEDLSHIRTSLQVEPFNED